MQHALHTHDGSHEDAIHGRRTLGKVARLCPEEGHGVIETADGLAVRFNVHTVIHGNFFEFEPGDAVHTEFSAIAAHAPLHATSVRPLGKHHLTE